MTFTKQHTVNEIATSVQQSVVLDQPSPRIVEIDTSRRQARIGETERWIRAETNKNWRDGYKRRQNNIVKVA
jgi:hypothetical protein